MKTFNKILKTDSSVDTFYKNYQRIEMSFPKLEEQITDGTFKIQSDPSSKEEFEALLVEAKSQLSKLSGVAKASIAYNKKHKEDGLSNLSPDSIEKLSFVLRSTKLELSNIDFAMEQVHAALTFERFLKTC